MWNNICNFLKLDDIINFHNVFQYPLSNKWLEQYNKKYSKINQYYNQVSDYLIKNIKSVYCKHNSFYHKISCRNCKKTRL